MKYVIFLLMIAVSAQASIQDPAWKSFKDHHHKKYKNDIEENSRYKIFKKNLAEINQLNKNNPHTHFAINQFSDLDPKEFEMGFLNPTLKESMQHMGQPNQARALTELQAAPANIDWSKLGATTPIKNQGSCGSCWAFSTTEQVESAIFMSGGQLQNLSAQQLTSCDMTDAGCNGGWPANAYNYMKANGIETTASYPYTSGSGISGTCNYNSSLALAHLTGFHYGVTPCGDSACASQSAQEANLQQVLANSGPASIVVYATPWQSYSSGIMTAQMCPGASSIQNHAIQLVGYDTDPATGKRFWIGRNQWGSNWGIGGYIHLELGTNACGLANFVTYVDGATFNGVIPPKPSPSPSPPVAYHCYSCSPVW